MNSNVTDLVIDAPKRNIYYDGKEMDVDVFELEQSYFNNKRYLLNRLVNGCGILHGLRVTAVDSTGSAGGTATPELSSVSVKPGVAIDCSGREISVPIERNLDIKKLNGYPDDFSEGVIYLCLKIGSGYLKTGEDVKNDADKPNDTDEDYEFLIKDNLPEHEFDPRSLYTQTTVLYSSNNLKIERITPRWVNPNELFEVRLVVKALQDIPEHNIRVIETFDSSLEHVQGLDPDGAVIFSFDKEKEKCYYLRSSAQPGKAKISVSLGMEPLNPTSEIKVITTPISDKITDRYFNPSITIEDESNGAIPICLAKLTITNIGKIIVTDPSATGYVSNNKLLRDLLASLETRNRQALIETALTRSTQHYFNEKGYLLNRFSNGSGIHYGLGVERADPTDSSPGNQPEASLPISVAPGIAMDCYGREIVLPQARTTDLTQLPGYPEDFTEGDLYLYIDTGPTHSGVQVTEPGTTPVELFAQDSMLFVQGNPPDSVPEARSLFTEKTVIFENENVRVERITPRWVNPHEVFQVTLVVTVLQADQSSNIRVTESFRSAFSLVKGLNENNEMTFSWNNSGEPTEMPGSYFLRSSERIGKEDIGAEVHIGETMQSESEIPNSNIEIITGSVTNRIADSYFATVQESYFQKPDHTTVCLAKLTIDATGISAIQRPPETRYVYQNLFIRDLLVALESRYMQTLAAAAPKPQRYIGTWMVLGPFVFHNEEDKKVAQDIIEDDINNGIVTKVYADPPQNFGGKKYKYKYQEIERVWKHRSFIGIDWNNIHDIEDNIRQHLPGDFSQDPFDPSVDENFAGRQHALAYFLIHINYIKPVDGSDSLTTKLFVRGDDAVRVWLRRAGKEEEVMEVLKFPNPEGGKDIQDFTVENVAEITLNEGSMEDNAPFQERVNTLLVSVANNTFEWGFSARIENDRYLKYTTRI